MTTEPKVLPATLVMAVESWADDRYERAVKYDNAELLDEDGVFTLHRLAAAIYAAGWDDGQRAEAERGRGVRRRERAAERLAARSAPTTTATGSA